MRPQSGALQSVEAEQSLLGAVLLDNRAFDAAAEIVRETDFAVDAHRLIWRAIVALVERGKPADAITVFESLKAHGGADAAGGLPYLNDLACNTPSAANIRRYAEVVHDKSRRRQMQAIGARLTEVASDISTDVAESIDAFGQELLAIEDAGAAEEVSLGDAFTQAVRYIDERMQHRGTPAGLPTGFVDLDALTAGLEPGHLIVLAGRPAMGKTLLASNIADAAENAGAGVLWFALEMPGSEMALRQLSAEVGVSVHDLRTGRVPQDKFTALVDAQSRAGDRRWWIDDRTALTLAQVRARAKRVARKHGLGLIVVDYIGLMIGQGDNRTQQLGSISRGLKALAKDLRVPVLALAQLNRGVEGRVDKRPLLSDLRDSGEIEQDADLVLMVHRESEYSNTPEWQGFAELLVRKNRHGPTGEVLLGFQPERGRFTNFSGQNPRALQQASTRSKRAAGFDDTARKGWADAYQQ